MKTKRKSTAKHKREITFRSSVGYNGWLRIPRPKRELWINVANIIQFETPGIEGKPPGWQGRDLDPIACIVWTADKSAGIGLTPDEWESVKRILDLAER